MMFSLRLNDEESTLIKKYAEINNISVSELFRQSALERIEDEMDLAAYNKAMSEYAKNPKSYTLDEVEKELGLN